MTGGVVRLASVVSNITEKSDGTPKPHIDLEDVESWTGRLASSGYDIETQPTAISHKPGDVLFSKLRPYLAKSVLATRDGTATGEMLVLRPRVGVDSRYLHYLTLSPEWIEWANAVSYGSKMPRASWEQLREFHFWLPSLDEQRRIADYVEAQTRALGDLSRLRRRQALLTEERFAAWRDRELEGFPLQKLSRLLTLLRDGTHQPPPRIEHGVPLLTARNVSSGRLRLTENDTFISEDNADELDKSLKVRAGDILMSVKGSVGVPAIVPTEFPRVALDRNLADLRVDTRHTSSQLMLHILRSRRVQDQFRQAIRAAAQPGLPLGAIRSTWVPSPPVGEQPAIVRRLEDEASAVQILTDKQLCSARLLTERMHALISEAITGKLDVTTARKAA